MRRTLDEEEKREPLRRESGIDRRRSFDALYSTAEDLESSVSPSAQPRKTLRPGTDIHASSDLKTDRRADDSGAVTDTRTYRHAPSFR
jgi:hypothetical protein